MVWLKCDFSRDGWLARAVRAPLSLDRRGQPRRDRDFPADALLPRRRSFRSGCPKPRSTGPPGRAALDEAIGGGGPVLGLFGRLDPHKGHREVLAVLPRLRERLDVRAVFFGADDPAHPGYREELAAEIAAAGLAKDAAALPGYRPNAVELITGCDVLVIPSVTSSGGLGKEGFSLVALEAMGVGTPVVAYDYGGPPEVLGDCGLLVPPGDRGALRDALLSVLEDAERRERLAACGRRRARERFSLSAMIEAMETRYRQAAA